MVCVLHMYQMLVEAQRGSQFPETGITGGCEPPYMCWESSLGPLGEKPVLLTTKNFLEGAREMTQGLRELAVHAED